MKTEQEQIEKMARIMCGYCSTDGKCAVSKNLREPDVCANVDTEHCLYKEYAERLFENGCYGDVSEYKTEIERLKAENEQSRKPRILGYEATVEFHDDIVSEPSADCKEKEIKQAKLNILGEMWARISHNKTLIQSHIADGSFTIEDIYMEIDELMAEVQNET